jgi:hypothetical protein
LIRLQEDIVTISTHHTALPLQGADDARLTCSSREHRFVFQDHCLLEFAPIAIDTLAIEAFGFKNGG